MACPSNHFNLHPLTSSCSSFFTFPIHTTILPESQMQISMYKWNQILIMLLTLQLSILIRQASASSFSTKLIDDLPDASIKCGECPCVNPCSQQPPTQPPPPPLPPPVQYFSPPPPRFVYVTGVTPPPPPRFVYVAAGPPGNLYPSDPFNLQIYSNASHNTSAKVIKLLLVLVFSALKLLQLV